VSGEILGTYIMGKNIIIFSDGTGQEGGKGFNSNVYKLFNMVEDRTHKQIAFYDRGLGSGWRKFTGLFFGMGISKNIKDCYRFIFENYQAGDRIYLFGFSRGASTVRSLSGFLNLFGILPRSRPELIRHAYSIYKISDPIKRKTRALDFVKKHHRMKCKVKFLGVWDTVSALGVPWGIINILLDKIPFFKIKFHDFNLCSNIENAYQALALDEKRRIFHPLLWNEKTEPDQKMLQVWFCGVHTDVGGGYREQELSDISLIWMIDNAKKNGLRIYEGHHVKLQPDVNGVIHNPCIGFPGFLYSRRDREWNRVSGVPVMHESVCERTLNNMNEPGTYYNSPLKIIC
jgi:uncharacterized protein (DUF2235 family)